MGDAWSVGMVSEEVKEPTELGIDILLGRERFRRNRTSSARTLGLDRRARPHRVIGEISGGDTTARLDRVLANMQIQKKEFDDVGTPTDP